MLTVSQEHILLALHEHPDLRHSKLLALATYSGHCEKTVRRALKTLVEKAYIRAFRAHQRGNCIYAIELTERGIHYARSVQTAEALR